MQLAVLVSSNAATFQLAERREHKEREHGEHHREPSKWSIYRESAGERQTLVLQVIPVIFALLGCVLIGRFFLMLTRALRTIKTSMATARSLRELASDHPECVLALPNPKPEAFVMGMTRPQLFASQGLLAMPDAIVQAVLAHERAHIRRFDPLRHLLALQACTFHLPGIAAHLQRRLQQAQELAADADAAQALGDATYVAGSVGPLCAFPP